MKTQKYEDFDNPRSSFNENQFGGVLQGVSGVVIHDDTEYDFTLHRQTARRSLMRGKIKLISPLTGRVLVSDGKPVIREITCSSDDPEDLKKAIVHRIRDIHGKYMKEIKVTQNPNSAYTLTRPDEITPASAFTEYGRRFISKAYPKSSDKKINERLNMLRRVYFGMPDVPMRKHSPAYINRYLKDSKFSTEAVNLASRFWDYCLTQGYCNGVNPFPGKAATRKSAAALQRRAVTATSLSSHTQKALFDILIANPTDMDCGVGLLSSGFSCEQICALQRKDIWFDPERPDHVRIRLYLPGRAGAQHNYTRPCTPQCARILRKRYEEEVQASRFDIGKAGDMYVLSGKRTTDIRPGDLSRYAANRLTQAGVENDVIDAAKKEAPTASAARTLLYNTYQKNLVLRCGLSSETDGGTLKFLCGFSLSNDVTASNYTSYTSEEAQERLYQLLHVLQPETDMPPIPPITNEDGSVTNVIVPRTTAEYAGIVSEFILEPWEEFNAECLHGTYTTLTSEVYEQSLDSIPNEFQK